MHYIKKYKKNKGGDKYYSHIFSSYVSFKDIHDIVRTKEIEALNFDLDKLLLTVLNQAEFNFPRSSTINRDISGDTAFLNRIIRNGGLTEYLRKLENAC